MRRRSIICRSVLVAGDFTPVDSVILADDLTGVVEQDQLCVSELCLCVAVNVADALLGCGEHCLFACHLSNIVAQDELCVCRGDFAVLIEKDQRSSM